MSLVWSGKNNSYIEILAAAYSQANSIRNCHTDLTKYALEKLEKLTPQEFRSSVGDKSFQNMIGKIIQPISMLKWSNGYEIKQEDIQRLAETIVTIRDWLNAPLLSKQHFSAAVLISFWLDLDFESESQKVPEERLKQIYDFSREIVSSFKIDMNYQNAGIGEQRAAERFLEGIKTFNAYSVYILIEGIERGRGLPVDSLFAASLNFQIYSDPKWAIGWIEEKDGIDLFSILAHVKKENLLQILPLCTGINPWLKLEIIRLCVQTKQFTEIENKRLAKAVSELYHEKIGFWEYLIRQKMNHERMPVILGSAISTLPQEAYARFLKTRGIDRFESSHEKITAFFEVFYSSNRHNALIFASLAYRRYLSFLRHTAITLDLFDLLKTEYMVPIAEYIAFKSKEYDYLVRNLSNLLDELEMQPLIWYQDNLRAQNRFVIILSQIFFFACAAMARGYRFSPSHPMSIRLLLLLADDRLSFKYSFTNERLSEVLKRILNLFGIHHHSA